MLTDTKMKPIARVTTETIINGEMTKRVYEPLHACLVISISDLGYGAVTGGQFIGDNWDRDKLVLVLSKVLHEALGDDAKRLALTMLAADF